MFRDWVAVIMRGAHLMVGAVVFAVCAARLEGADRWVLTLPLLLVGVWALVAFAVRGRTDTLRRVLPEAAEVLVGATVLVAMLANLAIAFWYQGDALLAAVFASTIATAIWSILRIWNKCLYAPFRRGHQERAPAVMLWALLGPVPLLYVATSLSGVGGLKTALEPQNFAARYMEVTGSALGLLVYLVLVIAPVCAIVIDVIRELYLLTSEARDGVA